MVCLIEQSWHKTCSLESLFSLKCSISCPQMEFFLPWNVECFLQIWVTWTNVVTITPKLVVDVPRKCSGRHGNWKFQRGPCVKKIHKEDNFLGCPHVYGWRRRQERTLDRGDPISIDCRGFLSPLLLLFHNMTPSLHQRVSWRFQRFFYSGTNFVGSE